MTDEMEGMEPSDQYGLLERDYGAEPVGTVCAAFEPGMYIPRQEWPGLIQEHIQQWTRPIDSHTYNQVPILNQGRLKYCWAYSVVAGVMNRLAFQGIDPVPHLSATAVAAVGMDYLNRGGHCSQAVKMIQDQGGVPNVEAWPNQKLTRTLESSPAVAESRQKNQLTEFIDCGQDLDAAISLMLAETPAPVTFSVPWWRHAILGLEVLDKGTGDAKSLDRYGIRFVNSYGPGWKGSGYGTFWGKKMEAWEYIAIQAARPREE